MNKIQIKNRYNDTFTFSKTDDGNILWEGEFKHCRFGWPNVYTEAYEAYLADTDTDEQMTMGEFKIAVHKYDDEKFEYTPLAKMYQKLVYSDTNKIDMVDPSGGPYMTSGMNMSYIDDEFEGMIIEQFKPVEEGYLIVIKNEK